MLIKSLPKSNAKTVGELLADVKAAILEEPKRANMYHYAVNRTPDEGGPSCGTAGCFAGWIQMLSGVKPSSVRVTGARGAIAILGHDLDYTFPHPTERIDCSVFNAGSGDGIIKLKPGTRAYARAVVGRINRFIAKNKTKMNQPIHTPEFS